MSHRRITTTVIFVPLLLAACADDANPVTGADYPSFSPQGKFDGAEADVRYVQDIGTTATVKGRFQQNVQYRGFTLFAEQGQTLDIELDARREVDGFLDQDPVDAQLMLYGPTDSQADLFDNVIGDSGVTVFPGLQHEVQEDGFYLVVATRPETNQDAQFELDVKCPQCQEPPPPNKLCDSGRLFIEGATLRSQQWRRCEVIVLEPTRLPAEETLVIGPDVDVRAHYFITDFHPQAWGETAIHVAGALELESTKDHPITFRTNVPGRQWRGLIIEAAGTHLHDFVMSDAIWGVDIKADGVRVSGAEFAVNRRGVRISGPTVGVEIEGSKFHDNELALTNRYERSNGSENWHEQDSLFVLDNEFWLNETAIDLRRVEGSFIDGVNVHHNDTGISIENRAQETQFADDWLVISGSKIIDNGLGISLEGNGVVDSCIVKNNATAGVSAGPGWQKVKNSRVEGNGRDCDLEQANPARIRECGALYAGPDAHTVFRNNQVRDNHGHGLVLEGRIASNVPRDPAVLNSEIWNNAGAGILFYNAPVFSVEFNSIINNKLAPMQFQWSGCPANSSERWVTCRVHDHRIERNIVPGNAQPIRFLDTNRPDFVDFRFHPRAGTQSSTRINAPNNFFYGLVGEELMILYPMDLDIDFDPTLDAPDPLAGLLFPLDLD